MNISQHITNKMVFRIQKPNNEKNGHYDPDKDIIEVFVTDIWNRSQKNEFEFIKRASNTIHHEELHRALSKILIEHKIVPFLPTTAQEWCVRTLLGEKLNYLLLATYTMMDFEYMLLNPSIKTMKRYMTRLRWFAYIQSAIIGFLASMLISRMFQG
jgi:hypothetical protein